MTNNPIYENGKLKKIDYTNGNHKWTIDVFSFFAVRKLNSNDSIAGKVIENYREMRRGNIEQAENYFDSKGTVLTSFIQGIDDNSNRTYDYVQIMLPFDKRRKDLLCDFSKKLFDGRNNYSKYFVKRDDTSIVGLECENAKELFHFEEPKITQPINSLHIIDDAIDKGCTISIFIDGLIDNNLIDTNTTISASIIYNNYGDSTPKFSLEML